MFSKKIIALLLSLSLLTSCSWLRDKPKPQKNFDLGLSCLEVMPNQLQNLFAGRYTENANDQASVKAIWDCLGKSLETFATKTRGSNPNYYTNAELLSFANRSLPRNNLFSKSLVDSIFMLKAAVLGGSNQNITQNEIGELEKKLESFGKMILPLSPYISTLLKPYESLSDDKRQIAGSRLNTFILQFADLLGDSKNTVTWKDLSSFVSELEIYLKSPNPTSLTVVREQIQLFQYLKILIVGGDESGIEKEKWHPIFKSISAIYNALYLTTSTTEMMEQLEIEIQSNDEEQKKATEQLTFILKKLKNDPILYSKSTVQLFADRWSKALVLNAFLYPDSQNQLAVKTFLSSPILKKLSGDLFDEVIQVKNGDQSPLLISKMAENLSLLIEKSGINQRSMSNISNLRDFSSQLKELFTEEKDYQILDSSLSILQDISSILIGQNSGKLTAKDFRALLSKASDLYRAWKSEEKVDFNTALSTSLLILTRAPSASVITVAQIQRLLNQCEKLFSKMEITTKIDWSLLKQMVIKGAKLKSVLFSNSDQNISNDELTQIYNTWKAFNEKKEIDETLQELAKYFQNNPYSTVKIADLMSAIDAFLPEDQKLSKLGLTPDLVGSLKKFLIGGQSAVLDRSEYGKMAQLGFTIFKNMNPVLKSLPTNFKIGLNSSTFALFTAGVQGLIDDRAILSNIALKELLLSQFNQAGMKIQPKTVDKLLIGFNFRILDHQTSQKPKTFPPSFPAAKLQGLKQFLEKTKWNYQDFEQAFSGVNETQSLPGTDLLKKLTRSDTKLILSSINPIISGLTSMPYFLGNGRPHTNYYLTDLYYKSIIFHGLMWIFPSYELETDQSKPNKMPRLSLNDLIDLFDDMNDAVYELGLSFSPESARTSALKRMQNVNLFTRTGNGDDYADVIETTDFLTTTFAGKNLLNEVRQSLVKDCYPGNTSYQTQEKFSYSCLKNAFFSKERFSRFYKKVVPQMADHYLNLNEAQRDEFRKSALTAVKAGWNDRSEMDLSDLETLVSIPYYVENIFLRLDHDFNSVLTFTEAMSGFPIFCREIKKSAGESIQGSCEKEEDPGQVEAIYGHLLMKGTAPRSIQPEDGAWQKMIIVKDFLIWVYQWRHLDRDPVIRDQQAPFLARKDLLNIISNLSTAIAPPESLAQP